MNSIESYVEAMNKVGCDNTSSQRIAAAVERERERANAQPVPIRRPARTVARRTACRIAAAAACAMLIAAGGTAVYGHFMQGDNAPAADKSAGSTFDLAAFADGTPVDGHANTVLMPDGFFTASGAWSEGDDETILKQFIINPDCVGDDVASITYRSTNPTVLLQGNRDRADVGTGDVAGTEDMSTFTVGGENATLPDLATLNLNVTIAETGELAQLSAEAENTNWDAIDAAVERAAADELASGTLEVTATLKDGSTVSHTYRILPVENFDEALAHNRAAQRDATAGESGTQGDADAQFMPLYMLEQVS